MPANFHSSFTKPSLTNATSGRFALGIEYNGSKYHGWASQANSWPSVQPLVEKALSKVANQPITLYCAGRTDKGVHAAQQIAHFDTTSQRSSSAWVKGANSNLPASIKITWAQPVPSYFHARFSAWARRYRYIILNQYANPALLHNQVTWWHKPLDAEVMHQAAQALVGSHDFSAFRSIKCQSATPRRKLHFISVKRYGRFVVIDVQANSFVHHMVRNLAGSLMAIGADEQPVDWLAELLISKNRVAAGITAPAEGLYLINVSYSPAFNLPQMQLGPAFLSLLDTENLDLPYPEFLTQWHRVPSFKPLA